MSVNVNLCFFAGNLTRDPELKSTPSGKKVVNFSIAVNREFKRGDGTKDKEVSYIELEAWDSAAQFVSDTLQKGDSVFVECSVKEDRWEDKDGKKRSKHRYRANNFQIISAKKWAERKDKPKEEPVNVGGGGDDEDSQIPF
jgi:single-strand DNA-binding protein